MTSTKAVREEIDRFLASSTPEVLCITGKWGVGKTHLWREDLKATQRANKLQMQRYAYVSLFGLNSLDDLRYAIFESTVPRNEIEHGPDYESLKDQAGRVERWARNVAYLGKGLPFVERLLGNTKTAFVLVRNQIVCIDDLERHGKDLTLKDVLGLISFLKEERKCKVVLLLNEERLPEESADDFRAQLEKVVDTRVTFDPNTTEAAEIGISKGTSIETLLTSNCVRLGIKNIRVIRKIERTGLRIAEALKNSDPQVLHQALHTATLFGWIFYQPKEAPSFEFVKEHYSLMYRMERAEGKSAPPEHEVWASLLSAYEFNNVDDLDEVIIKGIQAGAIDMDALKEEASKLDKQIQAQKKDNSFHEAWGLFHNSFSIPANEVLDTMYNTFKKGVDTISPMNLSGTISFFKELGRPEQARDLLEFYMANRNEEPRFFDLRDSVFGDEAKDPDVRAAFAKKFLEFTDDREPKDILIKIATQNGWNPDDTARIEKVSIDEFCAIFKSTDGTDLHRVIKAALQFKNFGGASPELLGMVARAEEALRRIGKESSINARRVAKYGIIIDSKEIEPEYKP